MNTGPIRDSYYKQLQNTVDRLQTQVEIIKRENVRLKTENVRMREALKPFADCVVHLHPLHDPEAETLDGIKVREWREAYAALYSEDT
jgi:regulator of replication initiation timing